MEKTPNCVGNLTNPLYQSPVCGNIVLKIKKNAHRERVTDRGIAFLDIFGADLKLSTR